MWHILQVPNTSHFVEQTLTKAAGYNGTVLKPNDKQKYIACQRSSTWQRCKDHPSFQLEILNYDHPHNANPFIHEHQKRCCLLYWWLWTSKPNFIWITGIFVPPCILEINLYLFCFQNPLLFLCDSWARWAMHCRNKHDSSKDRLVQWCAFLGWEC